MLDQPSSTTIIPISIRTVNKLLLRKVIQSSICQFIQTLHPSSTGKSPARSTFALILNRSNSASCHPINIDFQTFQTFKFLLPIISQDELFIAYRCFLIIIHQPKIILNKFFMSQSRELINTLVICPFWIGVMSFYIC